MIQSHELWMWFRAFVQSICSSILLQHLFPRLFHQLFELCKPIPPSSRHIKAIASIVFSLDGQRQSMKAIKTVHLIPSLLEAPEFNFWYRITGSRKFSKVFESFWNPRKKTNNKETNFLPLLIQLVYKPLKLYSPNPHLLITQSTCQAVSKRFSRD